MSKAQLGDSSVPQGVDEIDPVVSHWWMGWSAGPWFLSCGNAGRLGLGAQPEHLPEVSPKTSYVEAEGYKSEGPHKPDGSCIALYVTASEVT